MKAHSEQQISAFLENKPGVVANLCCTLTEHNINIRALTVLETVDIGTLRMVVDQVGLAQEVLKDAGAAYVVVPVLAIPISNEPGAFGRIARTLAQHGINIEYVYASVHNEGGNSLGIFRVSDHQRALQIEFDEA